jgi:DNA-directed RNA polymerase specialized sigma24 family protein
MEKHVGELNKAELVEKCLENSREAWEEFFRRYIFLIKDTVKRNLDGTIGSNIDTIEEITFRVFKKLYKKGILWTCKNPYGIESWLVTISRNQTIDWLKEQKRIKRLPKNQSEESTILFSSPLNFNGSNKTIEDILYIHQKDLPFEKNFIDEVDHDLLVEVFKKLQTVNNSKYKWVYRLSLLSCQKLSKVEFNELCEISPMSRVELIAHLEKMTLDIRKKEQKKKEDFGKSILYWHLLRRIENKLRALEISQSPRNKHEIEVLREKFRDKNSKREKLIVSVKKNSRPSNKDIAAVIGIEENKVHQVSNIIKRMNEKIFSNIITIQN